MPMSENVRQEIVRIWKAAGGGLKVAAAVAGFTCRQSVNAAQ
jgi:hypothetical protein